ncbi:hypothetical protein [Flammeovirga agarivorans]|uniref:Uncharacterized protein n=1 Tax=Flammeovirga agarivorans TaxID=2726742 RepID=A0A7X8SJT5_9BACT|nr:hypothetical protein [Flammeovirga agarivorans]NLR91544.1 hypothetical protein [Flammeovirga agarivorans]
MKLNIESLIPPKQNNYKGNKIALYFFFLFLLRDLARTIIMVFKFDGGMESITGLPMDEYSLDASLSFTNMYGLFSSHFVIFTVVKIVAVFRYREWIPAIYLVMLCYVLMAILILMLNPAPIISGAQLGIFIQLPLLLMLLFFSLLERDTAKWNFGEKKS